MKKVLRCKPFDESQTDMVRPKHVTLYGLFNNFS